MVACLYTDTLVALAQSRVQHGIQSLPNQDYFCITLAEMEEMEEMQRKCSRSRLKVTDPISYHALELTEVHIPFLILCISGSLLRTIITLSNAFMDGQKAFASSGLRKMQQMVDSSSRPLPPVPISPPISAAFFASQTNVTPEGPTLAEILAQSELVTQKVAIQATTAMMVCQLTDNALLNTMDVIDEDYDLFMEIAILLCSNPLNRSLLFKLVKKVIMQKNRILAHREELTPGRASLRKDLRAVFRPEPIMNGVKVYTEQTGSAHPINGRLLRLIDAQSWPATILTPTQSPESQNGSEVDLPSTAAKETELMTPKTSSGPGRSTPPARNVQIIDLSGQDPETVDDETDLMAWEEEMGIRNLDEDEENGEEEEEEEEEDKEDKKDKDEDTDEKEDEDEDGDEDEDEEDEDTYDDTDDIQEIVEDMDLGMD